MKKIAIITARGGSKRIPRKNIKDFLGKPIIAYSIEAALRSNLFDEVMVSTEDEEIAEVAKKYGARVPFLRSNKNADDYASTVDVLIEVLEAYKKQKFTYDYGCCIYPTAPFVNAEILANSLKVLLANGFDSVFPVVAFGNPIQRALAKDAHGKVSMIHPEHRNTRSQDLEKTYFDAGQFYWFSTKKLIHQKSLWTGNTGVIELNENQAQDIDNPIDWKLAELKFKLQFEE